MDSQLRFVRQGRAADWKEGGGGGACCGHDRAGVVPLVSPAVACDAVVNVASFEGPDVASSTLMSSEAGGEGQRLSVAVDDDAGTGKETGDGATGTGGGAIAAAGVNVGTSTVAEQRAATADAVVHAGSSTGHGGGEEVSGGCVVAGVTQAKGEEGGFDGENKGSLGCEAIGETVSVVGRTGLVWSREDDGAAKMSTPKGTGKARRRWKVGKEMGFTLLSEEEVVLNRLSSLKNRD
ncbi:hypothetical protein VNO80_00862 [Phaseolus coccineus]|uniref:Uncharacterized protein n=1 Tax=Phaseolus coccineus TaxID=3886 RepID=A0AAN9NZX4_PHACN